MREDILDAAERIVTSGGIGELTVRAVAHETSYGKSTVHTHIGSKDELLEALADRIMDRHIAWTGGHDVRFRDRDGGAGGYRPWPP